MDRIREVINELRKEIYKYPNVVGVSLTPKKKIVKGKQTDIDCVRIYVSRKVPEDKLRKDEVIPKEVNGVKTDVVQIGKLRFIHVSYTSRYRPVPAGVSVSRADENARGTLGWFIIDEDLNIYAISCNHVFAKFNQGKPGDAIVQPGLLDGGDPRLDIVFTLVDFVEIREDVENKVDIAWAKPVDKAIYYVGIIEHSSPVGVEDPKLDETVWKVGATTGYTEARVIDESAEIQLEHEGKTYKFVDVAIAQGFNTFAQPGDSGAPVLNRLNMFKGILFAGNEDGKVGAFCKTSNIISEISNKMGKNVYVFTYNTYPPYKAITKTVIKPYITYTLSDVLMFLIGFFSALSAIFKR